VYLARGCLVTYLLLQPKPSIVLSAFEVLCVVFVPAPVRHCVSFFPLPVQLDILDPCDLDRLGTV
jgi:hypothetical protein